MRNRVRGVRYHIIDCLISSTLFKVYLVGCVYHNVSFNRGIFVVKSYFLAIYSMTHAETDWHGV